MYSKKASQTFSASANSRLSYGQEMGAARGSSLEQMTQAGDLQRANDSLKQGLQSIKFPAPYDEQQAKGGHPTIFMKILHYVLFYSSSSVRNFLYSKDIDPMTVHLNDQKFMERVFYIITDILELRPQIQLYQFFKNGCAEQKMSMCSEVIEKVKALHDMTKTITKGIRSNQGSGSKSAGRSQTFVTPAKAASNQQQLSKQRTATHPKPDPYSDLYAQKDEPQLYRTRSKDNLELEHVATPGPSNPPQIISSTQANTGGNEATQILQMLKQSVDHLNNRLSSFETNMTQKISTLEEMDSRDGEAPRAPQTGSDGQAPAPMNIMSDYPKNTEVPADDNDSAVDENDFGYVSQPKASSISRGQSQNDSISIRNKSEKMKLIEQFLKMRYPLDHGFENQEELKWIITKIIPDLKTGLGNDIFEKNPDAPMWSDRNFTMELDVIINQVERVVFQKHLNLQAIAIVAHSIEESADRLNRHQKDIVQQLVCNSVLQRQFPATVVIKDPFYRNVSIELVKKMRMDSDQFFDTSSAQVQTELINFSQKQALRRMNPHTYCVSHLVKHYNLIVANRDNFIQMQSSQKSLRRPAAIDELEAKFAKTLDVRDQDLNEFLSSLALAMLEIYRETEDTADLDNDCLKEVIALAGMKHQEVYRRLLDQLIADMDNDHHFEILKLRGLAVVVLHMATLPVDARRSYWNAEDLNCCLNLVNRKFNSILQSDAEMHEQQECIYDTLTLIFSLAASLSVEGLKAKDAGELRNKFALNYATRAKSQDTNQHDLFSLRVKTDYATQALSRIDELQNEGGADATERVQLAFMAGALQMKSFVKINTEHIASSLGSLQTLSSTKAYKWHEIVQKSQVVARTNFNLFKSQYLGGEMKNETKRIMASQTEEDAQRIAYFIIEELYTIARDKSYQYEDRLYSVDCLKAMYSNRQICPIVIDWFQRTRKIQLYAKFVLVKLQNLPTENKNKEQISERAKSNLVSISGKNEDLTSDRVVDFVGSEATETNKMVLKGLKQKLLVEDFISSLRTRSLGEYRREVKHLCLIDIQGDQFVDGKVQKIGEASQQMKDNNERTQQSDIYKYFQHKRGKVDEAQQKENNQVVNHVLLYEAVPIFLNSSSAVMLIQGDAGTGKSVFLKVVEQQMWKAYERGHTDFIPIFIRLAEVINPYNCIEELMRSQLAGRSTYTQMKDSTKKFLFMLDGYDELKSPKNMYITNRLAEWKGTVKVIMTSRQEYLTAYGNYQKYFKPVQEEVATLLEYRITDVSRQQRRVYIEKRIYKDQNRILSLHPIADKEEIELLKEWGSLQKYEREIQETRGLEELIKTPYMLTIIVNILPELGKQKTSEEEGVTKSTIYKTFTRQHFATQALRLMDNKGDPVPKGFDLEASFYNYSLDISINMFLENKTSIPAIESSYQYPSLEDHSNPFAKFFVDDVKTRLARSGAQLIIVDGKARFSHKSIMEYFAARVLYECIKFYKVPTDPERPRETGGTDYDQTYLNEKVIKGSDLTDQESDVLNFVVDMLQYNSIKQNEMKAQGGDEGEADNLQSINALEKLKSILTVLNAACLDEENNVRTISWYVDRTWQYNVLLITCAFSQLLDIFDKRVLDAMYRCTSIPKNVREAMITEAIYLAETKNASEEVDKLCCRFVAVGMDAEEYEGGYQRPKEGVIIAHGHGKRTKDSATHEGEFKDGELVQTGWISIRYSSAETFIGTWKEGKIENGEYTYTDGAVFKGGFDSDESRTGVGELKMADGRVYTGNFEKGEIEGDGCLTNPMGDPRVYFDSNSPPSFAYETITGTVEKDYEGRKGEFHHAAGGGDKYTRWSTGQFRYESYPRTGIPKQNIEISIEFKTSKETTGISEIYYTGRDRGFMLRGGVPHIIIYSDDPKEKEMVPTNAEDLELNFADNQWHTMKMVIAAGIGKQMWMDGRLLATNDDDSSNERFQGPDEIDLGYCSHCNDQSSDCYFVGSYRNFSVKQYVPPDEGKKLVFHKFSGKDLKVPDGLHLDPNEGTGGLKGEMEYYIYDPLNQEQKNIMTMSGTLSIMFFKFDAEALGEVFLAAQKQGRFDEYLEFVYLYMKGFKLVGEVFKYILQNDEVNGMKLVKKYFKDDFDKIQVLKLENHPGKGIAFNEEYEAKSRYSRYHMQDENKSLYVFIQVTKYGEQILEFFNQERCFYNYSDRYDNEISMWGIIKNDDNAFMYWHINEDRTISPARDSSYALGYNEEYDTKLTMYTKGDDRVLIFKDIKPVYLPQGNIMPLILTSHGGKALIYDHDKRANCYSRGHEEFLALSSEYSEEDIVKVWLDKEGRICDVKNPYKCFTAEGYQSGRFSILSAHWDNPEAQQFTVTADGTIEMTKHPKFFLGTNTEGTEVKIVKANSEQKCVFKNFELLYKKEEIKS